MGEGLNRWSAVHRLDAARLYRLAIENAAPDKRYHGVGEEAISFKTIAEAIGKILNLPVVSIAPEKATKYFGMFAGFAPIACKTNRPIPQRWLNWQPEQATLLADLKNGVYGLATSSQNG